MRPTTQGKNRSVILFADQTLKRLVAKSAEDALEAAPPIRRLEPVEKFLRMFHIELHQHTDAVCATTVAADRVDAIRVSDHDFERRRLIKNSAADPGMPVPGLFKPGQVIDTRCSGDDVGVPTRLFIERNHVIAAEHHKLFGADLLIVIAGQ